MWYVYVLQETETKRFYTGMTSDLVRRMKEHRLGKTVTTSRMNHQALVYYEACLSKADAEVREKQLKTGFGRGYLKRRLENYTLGR